MVVHTTACPRNCYSTCAMRVTVEHGQITAIDPHEGNLATAEGPCLKGLSYLERVNSPERILHPMRRTASGTFERVSWDEALDLIARNLLEARRVHGPQSLFYYAASGTKGLLNSCGLAFWRQFGGCTTTYGDLCWPAGLEATRLTFGDNRQSAPEDIAQARLIVMWGKNAAETNLHQMRFIYQALEQGAKLVVIDPRRTPTSDRAHLLVQPRPGTDGALALGLAHLLIEAGQVDTAFIRDHVLGYEAFAELVKAWTPVRTAQVCGVPEAQLLALADLMGEVSPMSLCAGFGMQRYTNSGQTMRAIQALLPLTGNLGKPGAGWVYANLATQIFGHLKDPLDFYPPEQPDGVVRVSVSTARLGTDMAAQQEPPLKVGWVERGNPATQNPDTASVLAALRSLEFLVVVDERFTDTAREAHLILPSKSLFEQTDVIGAYWHAYLQIRQKVVEPPGEVRPETDIYRALGQRLGMTLDQLAACLPEPGDAGVEAWLEARLAPHGLSLDQLREGPLLAPGAEAVAFSDLRFTTPSGKVELLSAEAASRWGVAALPEYGPPTEAPLLGGRYPLQLLTPNTKSGIHSQFLPLKVIRQLMPGPSLEMGPEDAHLRGLKDGDRVRVFNDRGRLELPLRISLSLRPGTVVAFNGFGREDGGSVNQLSLGRETDMGFGAGFHDNLVDVERA
ncbi:molybdopterin-dependent oxidoreductase [Geothrix sp. PMB-07]|uniref:molybdopterin-containing oxidoreductase family protein n=1 Tax=Geothrix sp. PMB-07 TaxID=3068640 RepID=UPI00274254B5|nr:molybdopterin-dependent oxidoreductase [Geothrix sp. PMB-07]WLT30852.1 molybdopterin-dependent oxidoreductase [Geothrix sp. PMB-07]